MVKNYVPVEIEDVTDPDELAAVNLQRQQFNRNSEWLKSHAGEVYANHRGKCICIAGQELFVANTAADAVARATAAHPDDKGRFVYYIPKEKVARIYAH